jgi:hypothetical protein
MEQQISPETQELLNEVDNFAQLMKERLIEKSKSGYTGWKNQYTTQELIVAIEERLPRMIDYSDPVEIGIANWALIAHILKNKKLQNGK